MVFKKNVSLAESNRVSASLENGENLEKSGKYKMVKEIFEKSGYLKKMGRSGK